MKRAFLLLLAGALVAGMVAAAEKAKVRPLPASMPTVQRKGETVVKDTWDWPKAMIPVARKFKGTEGVVILIGDSLTYANQSTRWAWAVGSNKAGQYTESDKAILKWSHAYEGGKDTNGWFMAKVDRPSGRSETAASGIRTDQYIKGGFHNLPSLAKVLEKFSPQVVFILLGSNDVSAGREPADVLKDMNTIVESVINSNAIPVLTTLPPMRAKNRHERLKKINNLYLGLAAARKIPVLDLYGECVSRQPGGKWQGTLVGPDGVHLTHGLASGPPTKQNLAKCGYLVRCWTTVQKLKEVKAKVIDKAKVKPAGG